MKRILALILTLAMCLSSCYALVACGGDETPENNNDQTPHSHSYVDGKCSCGAVDPNYQPEEPADCEHTYVNGVCTKCEAADPNYKPEEPGECEHTYVNGVCTKCGEAAPHSHTPATAVQENVVDATCDKAGSYDEVVYCSECKEELSRTAKVIAVLGHTAAEAVQEKVVPATCESAGSYDEVVYCSECKAELSRTAKVIAKLDHTPAEEIKENYIAATCTSIGGYIAVIKCSVCEAEISREAKIIEMLAHEFVEGTCSGCGAKEGSVVECSHETTFELEQNKVAATCSKAGSYDKVVYCSDCGKEISRTAMTIEKLAHEPAAATKENVVAATCDKAGSYDEVVYCATCGEEISRETKTVEALGHSAAAATIENVVDATCDKAGSYDKVVYCSVCGAEISRETIVVEKLGHNYVDGVCSKCGAEDPDYVAPDDPNEPGVKPDLPDFPEIPDIDVNSVGIVINNLVINNGEEAYTLNVDSLYVTYGETGLVGHGNGELVRTTTDGTEKALVSIILEDNVLYIEANDGTGANDVSLIVDIEKYIGNAIESEGLASYVALIEAVVSGEYDEQIDEFIALISEQLIPALGNIGELAPSDEEIAAVTAIFEAFAEQFIKVEEVEGGVMLSLDLSIINDWFEAFKTMTGAELIDAIFGEGTFADLKEAVPAILALTIGDIVDMMVDNGLDLAKLEAAINVIMAYAGAPEGMTLGALIYQLTEEELTLEEFLRHPNMSDVTVEFLITFLFSNVGGDSDVEAVAICNICHENPAYYQVEVDGGWLNLCDSCYELYMNSMNKGYCRDCGGEGYVTFVDEYGYEYYLCYECYEDLMGGKDDRCEWCGAAYKYTVDVDGVPTQLCYDCYKEYTGGGFTPVSMCMICEMQPASYDWWNENGEYFYLCYDCYAERNGDNSNICGMCVENRAEIEIEISGNKLMVCKDCYNDYKKISVGAACANCLAENPEYVIDELAAMGLNYKYCFDCYTELRNMIDNNGDDNNTDIEDDPIYSDKNTNLVDAENSIYEISLCWICGVKSAETTFEYMGETVYACKDCYEIFKAVESGSICFGCGAENPDFIVNFDGETIHLCEVCYKEFVESGMGGGDAEETYCDKCNEVTDFVHEYKTEYGVVYLCDKCYKIAVEGEIGDSEYRYCDSCGNKTADVYEFNNGEGLRYLCPECYNKMGDGEEEPSLSEMLAQVFEMLEMATLPEIMGLSEEMIAQIGLSLQMATNSVKYDVIIGEDGDIKSIEYVIDMSEFTNEVPVYSIIVESAENGIDVDVQVSMNGVDMLTGNMQVVFNTVVGEKDEEALSKIKGDAYEFIIEDMSGNNLRDAIVEYFSYMYGYEDIFPGDITDDIGEVIGFNFNIMEGDETWNYSTTYTIYYDDIFGVQIGNKNGELVDAVVFIKVEVCERYASLNGEGEWEIDEDYYTRIRDFDIFDTAEYDEGVKVPSENEKVDSYV